MKSNDLPRAKNVMMLAITVTKSSQEIQNMATLSRKSKRKVFSSEHDQDSKNNSYITYWAVSGFLLQWRLMSGINSNRSSIQRRGDIIGTNVQLQNNNYLL